MHGSTKWVVPPFSRGVLGGLLVFFISHMSGAATDALKTKFDLKKDGFAFANDTSLIYSVDPVGELTWHRRAVPAVFVHSCFILCRSEVQFSRFAEFAPGQPKLSEEQYRQLVKRITLIPPWFPEPSKKIVIPGYRNLHEFSADYTPMLEKNLGAWWPSFLRVGNWRMAWYFPRGGQALAAQRLTAALDQGKLQAVYVTRFPHLNHCLLLYDYKRNSKGKITFTAYDPNYVGEPTWLAYHPQTQTFELQKRAYFNGGGVNVMRVYLSPFH